MKWLIALSLLGIAACSEPRTGDPSLSFGNAVETNIAAQVVNPNPQHPALAESDGERANTAFTRYRTDKVYQPHLPLESGRIYAGPTQQENER